MELIDTGLLKELLSYGSFAMILGMLLIVPLELILYGVIKAFGFFKL